MAYNANIHPGVVERTSVPPRSKHTADLDTSIVPPVTHERIQPTVQQDVLYEVRRDVHHYDLQTTIQPVSKQEFLPAKHWMQTPRGLVQIRPETTVQELYELGLQNGIQTAEGERVSGGAERKRALLEEIRMIEMAKVAQVYQSTEGISGSRHQHVAGQQQQQSVSEGYHRHHHHQHHKQNEQSSIDRNGANDHTNYSPRNATNPHHNQHSRVDDGVAAVKNDRTDGSLQSFNRYPQQQQNNPNYYDKQVEEARQTTRDTTARGPPSPARDNGPLENDLADLSTDSRAPLPPFEHASDRHDWDHDGGTRQSWNESVLHGGNHRNKLKKSNPPAHKVGVTKSEATALNG